MAHSHLEIEETAARSVLMPQDGPPVTRYTLNPYIGCGMGCAYCYVMKYPYAEEHPLPWGAWVQPKTNAPFLLGRARDKIWGRRIFVGSATDPYQYVERQYRLTRRCLNVLEDSNPKDVVVHTRSHLILDDVELLRAFKSPLRVCFSIPTDDDRVRKKLEPHAPRIDVRLKTMRRLRAEGIHVTAAVQRLCSTAIRPASPGCFTTPRTTSTPRRCAIPTKRASNRRTERGRISKAPGTETWSPKQTAAWTRRA